jgi:hypothetical protein
MTELKTGYDALRNSLDGDVIASASPEYDSVRAMWGGAIDRYPAAIAQCVSTADVAAAVRFAVDAGVPFTVRGGGHGFSGLAISDDSLLIDTARMKNVEVDASRGRAVAQPGVVGSELDGATQDLGLATTLGTISHTGIAGLTLGGGWGWLMRKFGLTADNLLSAEVVLADGEIVEASESTNPDLLWALRGGGGRFGAVTKFEYAVHPVKPEVTVSLWVFAPDCGPDPLITARDIGAESGRDRNMFIASMCLPNLPHFPAELRGKRSFVVICMSLDEADSDGRWMQPLARHQPRWSGTNQMPYLRLQSMVDQENPHGLLAHCNGSFVSEFSDEAVSTFVDRAEGLPGASLMYLHQMGGAVGDVHDDDTPIRCREADYVLNVITRWTDPAREEETRAYSRDTVSAFKPFGLDALPLNFEGDPGGLDLEIYGSALPRLLELKEKFDPNNVFGGAPVRAPKGEVN